jgi:pimeloyl-CoA synthetase
MNIKAYKIQAVLKAMTEWKLTTFTYASREDAIQVVSKALKERGIEFSVKCAGNQTIFLNDAGGKLATIVIR